MLGAFTVTAEIIIISYYIPLKLELEENNVRKGIMNKWKSLFREGRGRGRLRQGK